MLLAALPNPVDLAGDPERLALLLRCPKPKPSPVLECPCPVELDDDANAGVGDFGRLAAEANGEDVDANASNPVRFCGA